MSYASRLALQIWYAPRHDQHRPFRPDTVSVQSKGQVCSCLVVYHVVYHVAVADGHIGLGGVEVPSKNLLVPQKKKTCGDHGHIGGALGTEERDIHAKIALDTPAQAVFSRDH